MEIQSPDKRQEESSSHWDTCTTSPHVVSWLWRLSSKRLLKPMKLGCLGSTSTGVVLGAGRVGQDLQACYKPISHLCHEGHLGPCWSYTSKLHCGSGQPFLCFRSSLKEVGKLEGTFQEICTILIVFLSSVPKISSRPPGEGCPPKGWVNTSYSSPEPCLWLYMGRE